MAEFPPDESPEDHNGPIAFGPTRTCIIRLTDSARRYAVRHEIMDEIASLELGSDCLVGDMVSLEVAERPHDFIIQARRWVIASDGKGLEVTLDHPARRGRPSG